MIRIINVYVDSGAVRHVTTLGKPLPVVRVVTLYCGGVVQGWG